MDVTTTKVVFAIDMRGLIFAAHYGWFRARETIHADTGAGTATTAGVYKRIRRLLQYRPSHIVACWDSLSSFRKEISPDYKANRAALPENLIQQFPLVRELLGALAIPLIEIDGYEGDDICASVAAVAVDAGIDCIIVSGDKDLLQCVRPGVRVMNPAKGYAVLDREAVKEFMGVWPEQVVDYLAIAGDASDGIAGVKGTGVKGAAKLLSIDGSADAIIAANWRFTPADIEAIRLGKRLATLNAGLLPRANIADWEYAKPDKAALAAMSEKFGW